MVAIKTFEVERWMDAYENDAKYNLAESCSDSVSLQELQALSTDSSQPMLNLKRKQVYGAIPGSKSLRQNIANLYSRNDNGTISPDDVLVTPGAISANFLALFALVARGDHVICQYPTYQQLYAVPESHGAEVSLWKAEEANGWNMNLDALKNLIRPNTKLIIINNPQNPVGALLGREKMTEIVELARQKDIWVLSDEVYRPLFHGLPPAEQPPSILGLGYEKSLSTGSMSKAFSLAGIRLGWIATRSKDLIDRCMNARDYTTISVSQVDDEIAAFALSSTTVDGLLQRNMSLAASNLALLDRFIADHADICSYTRPKGGTTALVKFTTKSGKPVDDVAFCQSLQKETGVMFVPASKCFGGGEDFKGCVRFGYVAGAEVIQEGLKALDSFLSQHFHSLPAAS